MVDASFPDDLHTWTDVVDNEDIISGVHMNMAHAEIISVEQRLIDFRSAFQVFRDSSQQSIPNYTITTLQFNAADLNIDTCFDISSNYRFTAPRDGWYLFGLQLFWASFLANKNGEIFIYKNSTQEARDYQTHTRSAGFCQNISRIIYCDEGDYIYFKCKHNCGTAIGAYNGTAHTYAYGKLLYIP